MPIYDYNCGNCRKRFEIYLTYKEYGVKAVACPHCGSANVRRRAPRVRMLKGEDARLEQMSDPAMLSSLENDPQALGRTMRKMGTEMGEELPAEFDEMVDRLEAGQSPEEISSAMPEAGEDGGGSPGPDLSNLDD